MDIETTSHFFLPYLMIKESLSWIALNKIDFRLIETMESFVTETLLFGNSLFDLKKNPLFFLMHPLITFYLLKDSKKPYFNKF